MRMTTTDQPLATVGVCAGLLAAASLGCSHPAAESADSTLAFVSVEAGGNTTCGLTADRELYCWGEPLAGVMAVDSQADCTDPSRRSGCNPRPTRMSTGLEFSDISMSRNFASHLCGLTTSGEVYCWGRMLVTYDLIVPVGDRPTLRPLPQPAEAVSTGVTHDCAIVAGGDMYCWGDYDWNARGTGGPIQHTWDLVPNLVTGGWSFRGLAMGQFHSCGLELNGEALCWGWPPAVGVADPPLRTNNGCGLSGATCVDHPIRVAGHRQFGQLESAFSVTCGVDNLRDLYCWGNSSVGDGTDIARPEPVLVDIPGGVTMLSMGGGSCAISSHDVLYCWGANHRGWLGVGSDEDNVLSPTPVRTPVQLRSVSAGGYHTCGLDHAGKAWCWGWNGSGQLGTGDTLTSVVPVAVLGPGS